MFISLPIVAIGALCIYICFIKLHDILVIQIREYPESWPAKRLQIKVVRIVVRTLAPLTATMMVALIVGIIFLAASADMLYGFREEVKRVFHH